MNYNINYFIKGDAKQILENEIRDLSSKKIENQTEIDDLKRQLTENESSRGEFKISFDNLVSVFSLGAKRLKIDENGQNGTL